MRNKAGPPFALILRTRPIRQLFVERAGMNQALSQVSVAGTAPWLEAAAFGLLLCDAELTVMHANVRCGEMLGLAREHTSGRSLFDLLELTPAQRGAAMQELQERQGWQGLARFGTQGEAGGTPRALKVDIRGTGAGGLPDWLLRQDEIVIRDAVIAWRDDLRGAPEIELQHVDFRLQNELGRHRFGLRAVPPQHIAGALDVRGDLSGAG